MSNKKDKARIEILYNEKSEVLTLTMSRNVEQLAMDIFKPLLSKEAILKTTRVVEDVVNFEGTWYPDCVVLTIPLPVEKGVQVEETLKKYFTGGLTGIEPSKS